MISLITVGKQKTYNTDNYISKCKNIKQIEVKEEKEKNPEVVKEKEGKKLLEKASGFIVALSEEGLPLDSKMFAALLEKDITFIIGGAFGLSDEVKERADLILSLSKLTMPHDLAHLVLAEQIYRGQRILEGHPYHKE